MVLENKIFFFFFEFKIISNISSKEQIIGPANSKVLDLDKHLIIIKFTRSPT